MVLDELFQKLNAIALKKNPNGVKLFQDNYLKTARDFVKEVGASKVALFSDEDAFTTCKDLTDSLNNDVSLYNFILVPAQIPFMDTVAYILVIASLVQLVGLFIKKYSPTLYKSLGIYLPLITTNCAVLGVAQGNTDQGLSFLESLANGIGTSLGFFAIIVVFSCIRTRLESANTPKAFKGLPIALITAAIMAMAFMGLQGLFSGIAL